MSSDVTVVRLSMPSLSIDKWTRHTSSGVQRRAQALGHDDWMVDGGCINAQVHKSIVKGIFLSFAPFDERVCAAWNGATHQGIKVQQDVALPRRPRLPFGPALRVNGVSKQEEGLVCPPFLVLCHGVQAGEGTSGGGKPPSEVC